jgi:ribonuclease BN (tRNA processing enzyme)
MRAITLGVGGCFLDPRRGAAAVAVEAGCPWLLFDVGENAGRALARAKIAPDELAAVFLTHYHADHIGGLAPFLFALYVKGARRRPLPIYGPEGLRRLRAGLRLAFGDWLDDPGFELLWRELPWPGGVVPAEGVRVSFDRVEHSASLISLGYRVEAEGKVLTISGDTTACDGLRRLAAQADLLIAEAGYPDEAPKPNHLTPSSLAALAREVGVKRIGLTHFAVPHLEKRLTTAVHKGFPGEVVIARDGDVFEV